MDNIRSTAMEHTMKKLERPSCSWGICNSTYCLKTQCASILAKFSNNYIDRVFGEANSLMLSLARKYSRNLTALKVFRRVLLIIRLLPWYWIFERWTRIFKHWNL